MAGPSSAEKVRSPHLYYARESAKCQAGFGVGVYRNYCRPLAIAYGLCCGCVAERFRRGERATLEEDFVGNRAVAPAANVGKSGGCDATFIAEKHNDYARHRLLEVHGFAIALGENMLRE